MLMIPVDPNCTKPIYLQIVDHITALARNGQLRASDRLPPSRALAEQLQVHRSTIVNAYEELKARGIIEARQGSGSFIVDGLMDGSVMARPAAAPALTQPEDLVAELWRLNRAEGILSLALGLPADDLIPLDDFDRIRQRVLRRDGAKALNYEDPQGYYPLRRAIAVDLARHGILTEADDIIITWGAQEGVSLVGRALAAPGDCGLTEVPTFFGTLFNLGHLGINLLGFELSAAGPDWMSLTRQLEAAPAHPRFVSVIPDHHNPTGIRWAMSQRHEFLHFMAERDIPVIEDATYRDLTFEGPPHLPLRALDPEVIHVGSASKVLMPGLRIGFIVANGRLREYLIRLKTITSGSGEPLGQRALAEFLLSGNYAAHLERVVPVYRARRDAMLHALEEYFPPEARWTHPSGGFYVWVTIPPSISLEALFRQALERGIAIAPAAAFYPYGSTPNAFRLTYSRYPEEVLIHALRTLGGLLTAMLRHGRTHRSGHP